MECLKDEGVDVVFGVPGGANLPSYDALYGSEIRHILCRHEQGAGHAAEGYAKASGKVGVALATSGPGATNLVTAIADAVMDSVPTVFLTGQVRTELIGTDGFQEADVTGITMPIVKHSILIQDPREIPQAIHEAFHIARSGRPGPVLVDVPQDLSRADIPYEPVDVDRISLPGYQPTIEGNARNILPKLTAEYRALDTDDARLDGWWERIRGWQDKYPLRYEDSEDSEIKPQYMIEAMHEATGGEAIITSDVGQHQMWCA